MNILYKNVLNENTIAQYASINSPVKIGFNLELIATEIHICGFVRLWLCSLAYVLQRICVQRMIFFTLTCW